MSEPLTPEEEAQVRRRVRDYREADWGDDPDRDYHPERVCQAAEDAARLLATLDAARSTSEGLDVERLLAAFRKEGVSLHEDTWHVNEYDLPAIAREYAAFAPRSEEKE